MITRLKTFLANRGALLDAIQNQCPDAVEHTRLIGRGRLIAEELATLPPDHIRATLTALLSRVDIKPDRVELNIRRSRLTELLGADSIDLTMQRSRPDNEAKDVLTLTIAARLQRVGREMRMVVENTDDQTKADPGLLRIVARAHDIHETPDAEQRADPACYCQP